MHSQMCDADKEAKRIAVKSNEGMIGRTRKGVIGRAFKCRLYIIIPAYGHCVWGEERSGLYKRRGEFVTLQYQFLGNVERRFAERSA